MVVSALAASIMMQIVGVPVFLMFIMEEAIQAAGFGVFTLMQGKLWKKALDQVALYEELINKLEHMTNIYRIALTSEGAADALRPEIYTFLMPFYFAANVLNVEMFVEPYEAFVGGTRSAAEAYKLRIAEELGTADPEFYAAYQTIKNEEKAGKKMLVDVRKDHLFNLSMVKDEELDGLRLEKDKEKDDLRIERKEKLPKDYFEEKEAIVVWYIEQKSFHKKFYDKQVAEQRELYRQLRLDLFDRFVKGEISFDAWLAENDKINTQLESALEEEKKGYERAKIDLRVEYDTKKHDLAVRMKAEKKAFRMSDDEYNTLERAIVARYNGLDREIRAKYEDIKQGIHDTYQDGLDVLKTTTLNRIRALREQSYEPPAGEEFTVKFSHTTENGLV